MVRIMFPIFHFSHISQKPLYNLISDGMDFSRKTDCCGVELLAHQPRGLQRV
jgi:hypothetical protein